MNRQGFLKGSAILLVSIAITKILGLVYRIPLTRLLGGTGMGCFAGTFSVFTPIMAIFVAGIPSTMARLTAEDLAFERYANMRKTKRTAMILFSLSGLAAAVLLAVFAWFASGVLPNGRGSAAALICAAPALFFCTVLSVQRGYCEGLHNMYPTAVSEIIETVSRLIIGLGSAYATQYFALRSFSQTGSCFGIVCSSAEQAREASLPFVAAAAVGGASLSSAVACIYVLLYGRIKGDGVTRQMLLKDPIADRSSVIVRRLLSLCLPIAFTALITTLTAMIDMLTVAPCISSALSSSQKPFEMLLQGGLTAETLPNFVYGSYEGLASAVAGIVPTLTAMLGKSVLPSVAGSFAKGDLRSVGRDINKMLTLSAMIAFPSGMGVSLFAEDILQLLFSGRELEIAAAAPSLRVLGLSVVLMSLSLPCFTLLQALGRSKTSALILIVGGGIKLCANILLISAPATALIGAALSDVISESFICTASLWTLLRLSRTKADVGNIFVRPCYAGAMAVASGFLLKALLTKQRFLSIGTGLRTSICIIFSVIMYLIVVRLLCEMPKNTDIPMFCKKNRKNT